MRHSLYKYFIERKWAEAFLDGEVLFRSLAHFRDYAVNRAGGTLFVAIGRGPHNRRKTRLKPKKIPTTDQLLPMNLSTAPRTVMLIALLKPLKWAPFQCLRASPRLLGSASADFLKSVLRRTNPDHTAAAVARTNTTKSPVGTGRGPRFILWTIKRTQSQASK